MSIHHFVRGMVCADSTGTDPTGDTLTFYLHSPSSATCPNVQYGAVLPYHTDPNGRLVADGCYLDDYRGASKQHIGNEASIPFGWHLCDGTEGTPDLRSRFLLMAYGDAANDPNFDEHGHGDQIAAQGGTSGHNHFDALNQDEEPVAGQLHHYSNLLDDIETDDTELKIEASPGQTVDTSETSLDVAGSASGGSGYTDYEIVTVTGQGGSVSFDGFTGYETTHGKITTESGTATHKSHRHDMGTFGSTGCEGSIQGTPMQNDETLSTVFLTGLPVEGNFSCPTYPGSVEFTHTFVEPGGAYNPYDSGSQEHTDIEGGESGHHHSLSGSFDLTDLTLSEEEPGHRHAISGLTLDLDATIDPDPHKHNVAVKAIADALWIVDMTNYGEGDAAHYNLHHHHVVVDDHQLLPANHIPPYYALAQIMRTG
jgi:hypothetical protein